MGIWVWHYFELEMSKAVLQGKSGAVNDRWLFWFVYPIMALAVVHIGNENPLPVLLRIPSYYSDLLLALVCTFTVDLYFRRLFKKMDQHFSWNDGLQRRLGRHLIYGILLPSMVLVGLEVLYLVFLLEIPLSQSSVFYLETPIIVTFCALVNLLYATLYFRRYNTLLTHELKQEQDKVKLVKVVHKQQWVVEHGLQSIHIPTEQVAYFAVKQKVTWLTTFGGQEYAYGKSLEEVKKEVSPRQFFQLNRQVIAHRKAILSSERTETRKLKMHLNPSMSDDVFVSKSKAPEFMEWMKQE